jgi:acyl carrier protein
MVPDSASAILQTVAASIEDAGGLGITRVLAGDGLKDLGLSRLRLLAVLIELEDKFAIEFPSDAVDRFRIVGDIAFYIRSHEMTPYDGSAELPATATYPIEPRPSARNRLHGAWARARLGQPGRQLRRRAGWPMRQLARLFRDVLATFGVGLEWDSGHSGSEQQAHFCVIPPPRPATRSVHQRLSPAAL